MWIESIIIENVSILRSLKSLVKPLGVILMTNKEFLEVIKQNLKRLEREDLKRKLKNNFYLERRKQSEKSSKY